MLESNNQCLKDSNSNKNSIQQATTTTMRMMVTVQMHRSQHCNFSSVLVLFAHIKADRNSATSISKLSLASALQQMFMLHVHSKVHVQFDKIEE